MPMYFPDLKSVQECVEDMRHNKGAKQYKGIYPESEEDIPEARKQLAAYFRNVWNDELQAMEIEIAAANREEHDEKMAKAIGKSISHILMPRW